MRAVLLQKGLWLVVMGDEPRPVNSPAHAQREWVRFDSKAFGEIYLHVSDLYKHLLDGCQSLGAAWDTLRKHFEDVGPSARLNIKATLHASKLEASEPFDHFLLRTKEQVRHFQDMGEDNVRDWERELRDILLMGSLHLFQLTIGALEGRTRRDPDTKAWTVPTPKETILREADSRRRRAGSSGDGALVVKNTLASKKEKGKPTDDGRRRGRRGGKDKGKEEKKKETDDGAGKANIVRAGDEIEDR
ncbi:MAG: hypothetical protein BJ554DRAFT_4896, partial [Olpidium bornovanus]